MIIFTTFDRWDDVVSVRFVYDPRAVSIMKTAPFHRWDPDVKCWYTDIDCVDALASTFTRHGYTCVIDGEEWSPVDSKKLTQPLQVLFDALPAHLRAPVYRALSRALHPDAGGDVEWMKQLNVANDRARPSSPGR